MTVLRPKEMRTRAAETQEPQNYRVNLTVRAARALRLVGRASLRTVARKARATRPAGYAGR